MQRLFQSTCTKQKEQEGERERERKEGKSEGEEGLCAAKQQNMTVCASGPFNY